MIYAHGKARRFHFSLRALFVAMTLLAVLCVVVPPLFHEPDAEIKAAAIATVARQTSTDPSRLRASAMKAGADWSVVVWRLPETPGGHVLLMLSEEGKVKEYYPGL